MTSPAPAGGPSTIPAEGVLRSGLKGAGFIALAGLLANGANVVTTFVLSHILDKRGYGAFNLLVYLFLVLSMPGYAVIVAVVRKVSRWELTGDGSDVGIWSRKWRWVAVGIIVAVLIGSLAAGPAIASGLSLPNAGGIAPILTAGAAWVLLSVDRGLIQAHRLYGPLARNLLVEGGVRTAGTLLLAGVVGLGVQGAMLGILASAACADLDARLSLHRDRRIHTTTTADTAPPSSTPTGEAAPSPTPPPGPTHSATPPPPGPTHSATLDFVTALGALALLASLAGLDIIVLGRTAPQASGPYGAIAVVSKVLFFAALILSGYLLPEATTRWHRGEHALRQLAITLGILLAAAALEELVTALAAHRLMALVFPSRLLGDSGDLAYLVGAMGLLSVSVILTYYLLGIGRRPVVFVLAGGTALLTVLLVTAGGRPGPTVHVDLAAQGILVAVLAGYLWWATRPARRATPANLLPPASRLLG